MSQVAAVEIFKDGEFIFKEKEIGECIYVVDSGRVELCKMVDGILETIEVLKKGEIFGEYGFFAKVPRPFSAKAVGMTRVKVVHRSFLDQEFCKLSPDFQKILMNLALRIVKTTEKALRAKNHRSQVRFRKKMSVKYQNNGTLTYAKTENVSEHGLFIITDDLLDTGDTFFLDLYVPKISEVLTIKSEVCWCRKKTDDPINKPIGMGIKFLGLSKNKKSQIKSGVNIYQQIISVKEKIKTSLGVIELETLCFKKPIKPHIFFAPGFATTLKSTRIFRRELASRGYSVTSIQYPRNLFKPGIAMATFWSKRIRPRILKQVFSHLEKEQVEGLIVIGHSCAAIDIAQVLTKADFSDLISFIILANPAGMTVGCENMSYPVKAAVLGSNFTKYLVQTVGEMTSFMPKNVFGAYERFQWLVNGAVDVIKNPIEAVKDAFVIVMTNIVPQLIDIRKQGINTILYINQDEVFPLQEIMRHANQELIPFAIYSGEEHSHHSIILNAEKSVEYIENLIQFQEIVNTLSHTFPDAHVIETMLMTKVFNLDVIHRN